MNPLFKIHIWNHWTRKNWNQTIVDSIKLKIILNSFTCIFNNMSNNKTITCPITVLLLFFGRQRRMFSKRLSPFTTNHLSQEVGSHKGYTLVGIPGQFYHQQIENTFKKVRIILNIKYLITIYQWFCHHGRWSSASWLSITRYDYLVFMMCCWSSNYCKLLTYLCLCFFFLQLAKIWEEKIQVFVVIPSSDVEE